MLARSTHRGAPCVSRWVVSIEKKKCAYNMCAEQVIDYRNQTNYMGYKTCGEQWVIVYVNTTPQLAICVHSS